MLHGTQRAHFCRKHLLWRAFGCRDQHALPGRPTINLQPSLRTFDWLENACLHFDSTRMVKCDCKHIWKLHPAPMWWRVVATDFMIVTVDNQLKQLGRPQGTIRLRCGTLIDEGTLLVSQARSFRGRLHGTQQGKQATAQSSRIGCGSPQDFLVRADP